MYCNSFDEEIKRSLFRVMLALIRFLVRISVLFINQQIILVGRECVALIRNKVLTGINHWG
jgi:hypothetical protein